MTRHAERLGVGRIVGLERAGSGGYLGQCHSGRVRTRGYGGAVLAHALAAAGDTAEAGRGPHSLHAYFLASVDPAVPVGFEAASLRAGRNYSVVRVEGTQNGRHVFTMTASFKQAERDAYLRHVSLPAGIAAPEDSPDGFAGRESDWPVRGTLEYREAGPLPGALPGELARASWLRTCENLGSDAVAQACGLAYLSDVSLSPTAFGWLAGRARPEGAVLASLDHAMWFHTDLRELRSHEWLLFVQRSRIESDGRTFNRGPYTRPASTGASSRNHGPSAGNHECAARPASE
ncbi:acyl-CoA thioesterase-2 [Amycolatopsis echigonensis]|uniref:Acyl-CoA thioesterase-2 n=1 Tax=Amycolatopsis echigonensis TaxID=2576905 RepID=A0A2N3X1T5_9PSEU|nr:acyl-CoA thioesterase-2 [Amycolatopsis niigatensis]